MKRASIILAVLLVATATQGQGTVNFVNKITGTLDARVLASPFGAAFLFRIAIFTG